MKKFLLAIAALASVTMAMNATDLVTPTGTKTEFCADQYEIARVANIHSLDANAIYDYYINDDGTFYIRNFVNGKGYFKGTISGSAITIPVPQAVYEEDGVTYYVKAANFGDFTGDALLNTEITMSYYPTNGKINTAFGIGIYAGDNTTCERAVYSSQLYSDRQYSEPFELVRIAEDTDGQVYTDVVTARYLLAKDPDYMVVNGMFPGSNEGQMIDDWGSKWRFTDIQKLGTTDDGAPIFSAMLNDNNMLISGYRTFTKTTNGEDTEWNMDEGQTIMSWYVSGSDDDGLLSTRIRTISSLKLTTDLSQAPATAISGVETGNDATEVARYNLAGQRVSADTKGVVIVRMSDGTAHKVMVK